MAKANSNPLGLASVFEEEWSRFIDRLNTYESRLLSELETCWRDLQAILDSQMTRSGEISPTVPEPPTLDGFHSVRTETARELLHEPISQVERRRPYQRALSAVTSYDRNVQELLRSMPKEMETNGIAVISALDQWVQKGLGRRLAGLRRKERSLPFKAVAGTVLYERLKSRTTIEGQYFLGLVLLLRQIRRHWELARAPLDASASGRPISDEAMRTLWDSARSSAAEGKAQVEKALEEWRRWSQLKTVSLAERMVRQAAWPRRKKFLRRDRRRAGALAHWGRLWGSGEAEIHLEEALERTEDRILRLFSQGLDSLSREHTHLLTELDAAIGWLRGRIGDETEGQFPPPKVDVVPAASRLKDLDTSLMSELTQVPETVEMLSNLSPLPPRRTKWTVFQPRDTLYRAYTRTGRGEVVGRLEAIEAEHNRLVQQIEQAREVVAFGVESARSGLEVDRQVAQEAVQNALSMLEFDREETRDWRPATEAGIAKSWGGVFVETRIIMNRRRLGALAYLAQQGLRRALILFTKNALTTSIDAFRRMGKVSENVIRRFLVAIGWTVASEPGRVQVVIRPFLPEEFTVDLSTKDLPAIYWRLFRFEAVQDPRFLVGREKEMAAIDEARSLWERGRPGALLIVGERGSGKTSLINCALRRSLSDLEVIRGEFRARLMSGKQLHGFMATLVGIDDPDTLERFLAEKRRVVILEELERTFLRQVGCYQAIRALQRLIAATCSTTLWILVINQVAYQFLDAAVDFGNSFSHRINAASAGRDALRQAIMLRHNLSGLRLNFATIATQTNLVGRLKGFVQGQADPERLFFDTLARESGGIFRSAFDIWLGQIESVQAGVMYMKPLLTPDLSPVIDDLNLSDLFSLVAIMQHGSLTAEEHSTIFQKSIPASQADLDELLAREIIEPDPGRSGLRVRPEAVRVAHEALYRRNLL